jgi:hypothetical protein
MHRVTTIKPSTYLTAASILLLLTLLLLLPTVARADKYAGAFMDDGGGARALALGGAFTAVADDPSTTYWNPAGLSGVQDKALLVMHSERFGDLVDRDFASYIQPVDWSIFGGDQSGLGISLIRLGIDDIPFTEDLRDALDVNNDSIVDDDELLGLFALQDQIQFKSDSELALFLSYAERKGDWRIGGSFKFIRQSVGDYSSLGIGLDLGLYRPAVWRGLDVGLKLQDITTTYLSWSTGRDEIITPAIVPGLAWRVPLDDWRAEIMLAGSLETRFDNRGDADQFSSGSMSMNSHVGLEVGFSGKVFLRGGFDSGFDNEHLTAGAGFIFNRFHVDYAYGGDILGIDESTSRISMTVDF